MYRTLFAVAASIALSPFQASAQQPATARPETLNARTERAATPRVVSSARTNVGTTIQGNALTSTNGALASATVRLRDARAGHIVGNQVTDKSGLFSFGSVDPGSYVVEIVSNDQVLAASQILNVNAGEALSAVVKLPFKIPPFAGVLGNSTPSALAVTAQAAASGILALGVAGEPKSANQ
jgi:hypothetical protein